MFAAAAIALIFFALGAVAATVTTYLLTLNAVRSQIDQAHAARDSARASAGKEFERANVAEAAHRELQIHTLQQIVARDLIPPAVIAAATAATAASVKHICGCGHSRAFHDPVEQYVHAKGQHLTTSWGECNERDSSTDRLCRCVSYTEVS